jgi:nucleoside phosphorylase/predicted nucleotidyltransferase
VPEREITTFRLSRIVSNLSSEWPDLEAVHLFGSRRYATGSPRSDVDLLLSFSAAPPASTEVAEAARRINVYIDAFLERSATQAQSVINNSIISATSEPDLTSELNAVTIWSRGDGFVGEAFDFQRALADHVPVYSVGRIFGERAADREPIDYLIVTAVANEFRAVESALGPYVLNHDLDVDMVGRQVWASIPRGLNNPGGDSVVLCQSDRMGNLASGLTTADALARWAPSLVILTGITGGIAGRSRIGDLLIADRIVDYEAAKVRLFGSAHHGIKPSPSADPIQRAMAWVGRDAALSALDRTGGPGEDPRLRVGGFASGEKVIASRPRAWFLSKFDRKLAAIEVESLGVADACRRAETAFFVLKAVSDLADRNKSDDYQPYCCRIVAEFLIRLIAGRVLVAA